MSGEQGCHFYEHPLKMPRREPLFGHLFVCLPIVMTKSMLYKVDDKYRCSISKICHEKYDR